MKVTVTQKHIDQGERSGIINCPLALALRDATGQPYQVGFAHYWIKAEVGKRKLRRFSTEAGVFIAQFDSGGGVVPCEIEMDLQ